MFLYITLTKCINREIDVNVDIKPIKDESMVR